MRTTIDLPEDVLRMAKATAAIRGMKLKDFIAESILLNVDSRVKAENPPRDREPQVRYGQHRPIPVTLPRIGPSVTFSTNAEIEEMFLKEDLERAGFPIPLESEPESL